MNVSTVGAAKKISAASLELLIPGHLFRGSNEYIHSGLYSLKNAKVASVSNEQRRGSLFTTLKFVKGATIDATTEGSTEAMPIESLTIANGDGADYVLADLVIKPSGATAPIKQNFAFESCAVSNQALLRANGK